MSVEDKLATALLSWDSHLQFILIVTLGGLAVAAVAHAVATLGKWVDGLIGLARALVTVPIVVFWGWPDGGTPTKTECHCHCDDDDEDDEDDDKEEVGERG